MNIGILGPSGYADMQREARVLALLAGATYVPNCSLAFSVAGGALTVRILTAEKKDPSAANPIIAAFHDADGAESAPVIRRIAQPLRLTIPSTATLGFTSATAAALWFVLFDDVTTQTQRLGVINCLSGTDIYPLGGWPIASATAVSTAADSAHTFYTDAALTSMPYVILGRASWETGLSTAGTWDALPTRVRMHGSGGKLPGDPVQRVVAAPYTASTAISAIAPLDDTAPTTGETTEILTKAITLKSASSQVDILVDGFGFSTGSGSTLVLTLYRGSTPIRTFVRGSNTVYSGVGFSFTDAPGTTSPVTYSVRVASTSVGAVYMNGNSSGRLFGGTATCTMGLVERFC